MRAKPGPPRDRREPRRGAGRPTVVIRLADPSRNADPASAERITVRVGTHTGAAARDDQNEQGLDWRRADATKMLHLTIDGGERLIKDSRQVAQMPWMADVPVMWRPPPDNPQCTRTKLWRSTAFPAHTQFLAFYRGRFCAGSNDGGGGEGGEGEGGGDADEWVAGVLMADLDADADNDSQRFRRPPTLQGGEGDQEDVAEQAPPRPEGPSDAREPGLLVCVNRGFEEGGAAEPIEDRDRPGIAPVDRDADAARGAQTADPDLVAAVATLKVPNPATVTAEATLTYGPGAADGDGEDDGDGAGGNDGTGNGEADGDGDEEDAPPRILVYAVDEAGDHALIESGVAYPFEPDGPRFEPATEDNPLGTFQAWGPRTDLLVEGQAPSPAAGEDAMTLTLTPANGTESRDRVHYTVVDADIDVDADNDSSEDQRPPQRNSQEELEEDPPESMADASRGYLICVNRGYDEDGSLKEAGQQIDFQRPGAVADDPDLTRGVLSVGAPADSPMFAGELRYDAEQVRVYALLGEGEGTELALIPANTPLPIRQESAAEGAAAKRRLTQFAREMEILIEGLQQPSTEKREEQMDFALLHENGGGSEESRELCKDRVRFTVIEVGLIRGDQELRVLMITNRSGNPTKEDRDHVRVAVMDATVEDRRIDEAKIELESLIPGFPGESFTDRRLLNIGLRRSGRLFVSKPLKFVSDPVDDQLDRTLLVDTNVEVEREDIDILGQIVRATYQYTDNTEHRCRSFGILGDFGGITEDATDDPVRVRLLPHRVESVDVENDQYLKALRQWFRRAYAQAGIAPSVRGKVTSVPSKLRNVWTIGFNQEEPISGAWQLIAFNKDGKETAKVQFVSRDLVRPIDVANGLQTALSDKGIEARTWENSMSAKRPGRRNDPRTNAPSADVVVPSAFAVNVLTAGKAEGTVLHAEFEKGDVGDARGLNLMRDPPERHGLLRNFPAVEGALSVYLVSQVGRQARVLGQANVRGDFMVQGNSMDWGRLPGMRHAIFVRKASGVESLEIGGASWTMPHEAMHILLDDLHTDERDELMLFRASRGRKRLSDKPVTFSFAPLGINPFLLTVDDPREVDQVDVSRSNVPTLIGDF